MSAWSRIADATGRFWARVERAFHRLFRKRRRSLPPPPEAAPPALEEAGGLKALEEGARQVGQEVLGLGQEALLKGQEVLLDLWDKVDDLPFVPSFLKIIPVRNQFYGHGAFMGAAPALLADARWRRILAFLMPDVFEQVNEAVKDGAGPSDLIPMFENNPVMCAFGVWRNFESRIWLGQEGDHDLSGMEWDVFIDGDLVAELGDTSPAVRPELVNRLVSSMVIAHASTTDTVQEAIGVCQYRDVRKTPKTRLGGVEMGAWLDLYGRSLQLARATDVSDAIRDMRKEPRVESEEECARFTFVEPLSTMDVVDLHRAVTGRRHLSVILEIKSLRSTPALLRAIVRDLNVRGIHVVAVCSFRLEEVAGVSEQAQVVCGDILPGPREVLFFHFAGDVQDACDAGRVPRGQSLLFNGASLLDADQPDPEKPAAYKVKSDVVAELEQYRERFDLHVGLYVQEGDCDNAAAELLSDLLQSEPRTFELGFAWGGLQDEVAITADQTPRLGYGSQKALALVGRARQWEVGRPPPAESTPWDDDAPTSPGLRVPDDLREE